MAFPEKLLKTIATRCAIFSLKFTKNRLAAGLPRSPSRNMGPTSKGRRRERRGGSLQEGRREEGRGMREGRKWRKKGWREGSGKGERMGGKEKGKEGKR